MSASGIFWNLEQQRLRAGWRLSLQFVLFLGIAIGSSALTKADGSGVETSLVGSLVLLGGVLGSVGLLARFVDHRPFADFGFHVDRAWWLDLGFGLSLGAFMLTGIFLTEQAAGLVVPQGPGMTFSLSSGLTILAWVIAWTATGVNEELVFRGYQLKNLAEGLEGRRLGRSAALASAVAISSIVFGLTHLFNQNSTALSTLNIIVGGLLLSLPVVWTGELAISIGLHITWNMFEGTVYGFPVSGGMMKTHLISIRQAGPDLWTGGAFGPEGGLVCTLWMLIDFGLVAAWVRIRRRRMGGLREEVA